VAPLRARGLDSILDLGSGGGYPGFPLAMALPTTRALLVDSVGKKAAFLETVVGATGVDARVSVATARAEALASDRRHRERWAAVTSRAVGSVAETAELGFPLLRRGGCVLTWKRLPIDAELDAAQRAVEALGGGTIDVVPAAVQGLAGHVLVIATKRGATGRGYPRDPAERRRRPW
jgi:16S rRNA (guanine527-N7)-methyltransferase